MLGSDDANLLVNAAHQDEEGGGDATVVVGNQHRKANNVLDTPWYAHCYFVLCFGYISDLCVLCRLISIHASFLQLASLIFSDTPFLFYTAGCVRTTPKRFALRTTCSPAREAKEARSSNSRRPPPAGTAASVRQSCFLYCVSVRLNNFCILQCLT